MSQFFSTLLGFGKPQSQDSTSTSPTLPSSWYCSDDLYQLERRAIFSKRWILVTHKLRFTTPGDFVQFEEAGFCFFLCLDRKGNINGFHNVCRHRAFPVMTKPQGRAKIISCRYHGWSYGLDGKLAKAPGYDEMEDFDPQKNGLFPVNVHTDNLGFVWVNMDATKEVEWEDDFQDVDRQERFQQFDFEDYRFDHTWEQSGNYNWKTLADNYNECYHCPTTHPDVAGSINLKLYAVEAKGMHLQHYARVENQTDKVAHICSTFYFPNACMTVSPAFFYLMRCVPTSAHHCSMEYEVYRHKDASDESFTEIDSMFKRVLSEDKDLCNSAQKNLEAGVYVSGKMHSRMETGPLFVQGTVRQLLKRHREREIETGQEIWPARQSAPNSAVAEDVSFCSNLSSTNKQLQW